MTLNELPAWIAPVLLLMALAGCVYALLAAALVGRFAARRSPLLAADAPRPGVTILKPLCGLEPDLFENLESFCRQDYAGAVQVVFGVQNAADPAIAVVERLRAAHPALRLDLVVDATGAPEGFAQARALVRPRGTLVLKSTFHGETPIAFSPLVVDEITLVGSRCGPFQAAIDALANGRITVKPLIEGVYPLERFAEAFGRARGGRKQILTP